MLLTRKQIADALDLSERHVGALIRRLGIAPVGRAPATGKQGMRAATYSPEAVEQVKAASGGVARADVAQE